MEEIILNEKPRLLIVDDEETIRTSLKRHFDFLGYDVSIAPNGKKALELMSRQRCDVIITDIMMPEMDGIDLLRELHKHYPMAHCIVITGYVTMDNILACMRHGADTCVFKPLEDLSELEEAVKKGIDELLQWQRKLKTLLKMKPKE